MLVADPLCWFCRDTAHIYCQKATDKKDSDNWPMNNFLNSIKVHQSEKAFGK
jgi:hypothetical protein